MVKSSSDLLIKSKMAESGNFLGKSSFLVFCPPKEMCLPQGGLLLPPPMKQIKSQNLIPQQAGGRQ